MEQTDDATGSTSIRPATRRLIEQSDIKYQIGVFAKAIEAASTGIEEIGFSFGNADGNTVRRYIAKIDDFIENLDKTWPIIKRRMINYLDE